MRKLFALVVFAVVAFAAEAQEWCQKCYYPPSEQLYCGTTIYNGAARCEPIPSQNGCSTTGGCEGSGGEQCGWPHCIPDRWACSVGLPEKAPWTATSSKVVRVEQPVVTAARRTTS